MRRSRLAQLAQRLFELAQELLAKPLAGGLGELGEDLAPFGELARAELGEDDALGPPVGRIGLAPTMATTPSI